MKEQILVGEEYLRSILDAFPSPVLIVDKNLSIHDANAASKQLLGNDIDTKIKRLCGDLRFIRLKRTLFHEAPLF